jgi:hypothetical protein
MQTISVGSFDNCRPLGSHHEQVQKDFVFSTPPPPFCEGTYAVLDVTLDRYWRIMMVLLFGV